MADPFRLQTLLDYRDLRERQTKQDLAAALKRRENVLAEISRMQSELESISRDFVRRQVEGIPAAEIDLFQTSIQLRQRQLAALEEELQQKTAEVTEARARLLKASKEKKSVERLHERHQLDQRLKARRKEGAILDEIALRNLGGLP